MKTALKLLLVFVEYTEQNSQRIYDSVQAVDDSKGETTSNSKLAPDVVFCNSLVWPGPIFGPPIGEVLVPQGPDLSDGMTWQRLTGAI